MQCDDTYCSSFHAIICCREANNKDKADSSAELAKAARAERKKKTQAKRKAQQTADKLECSVAKKAKLANGSAAKIEGIISPARLPVKLSQIASDT